MLIVRSLKTTHNLADDEFSHDFDFGYACKLTTVYLHSSLPITEDVEVWFISADGENYHTLIDSSEMVSDSDYVFSANGDIAINEGDKIRVKCTNANGVGFLGVTCKVEL